MIIIAYTIFFQKNKGEFYYEKENEFERNYFDTKNYEMSVQNVKDFYSDLFSKRAIKTDNPLYDNFINYFTPLQMSVTVNCSNRPLISSALGLVKSSQ